MNGIQKAAKLYECRDTARTLLGAEYPAKIAEWKKLVADEAKRTNRNALEAAITLNKRVVDGMPGDGFSMLLIFAAAVEIIEPSANAPDQPTRAPGEQHGK